VGNGASLVPFSNIYPIRHLANFGQIAVADVEKNKRTALRPPKFGEAGFV
jgi:hypothetical protein